MLPFEPKLSCKLYTNYTPSHPARGSLVLSDRLRLGSLRSPLPLDLAHRPLSQDVLIERL